MEIHSVSLEQQYKKSEKVVFRYVAGEAILVPLTNDAGDLNSIFALNETAATIWELLDGEQSLKSISEKLVAEYDVTESIATSELLGLIEQLITLGAIVKI